MAHPLLSRLSSDFAPVIRARGRDYFERGAVRLAETTPERVLAVVQGTRRYTVDISFGRGGAELSCSCPYFMDQGEPCKHLWAVLLKLDGTGYLSGRDRPQASIPAALAPVAAASTAAARTVEAAPEWERTLRKVRASLHPGARAAGNSWPAKRQLFYVFDAPRTLTTGQALVRVYHSDPGRGGARQAARSRELRLNDLRQVSDPGDRAILSVLRGTFYAEEFACTGQGYQRSGVAAATLFPTYHLDTDLVRLLLPRMCATGRLYLQTAELSPFEHPPVRWDEGEPWEFHLELGTEQAGKRRQLQGLLRRGTERMPLSQPELLIMGGLLFAGGALSRYREFGSFGWITNLRLERRIQVQPAELPALLNRLLSLPHLPPLEIDESVGVRTLEAPPLPRLKLGKAESMGYSRTGGSLAGELSFGYGDRVVAAGKRGCGEYLEGEGLIVLRRKREEHRAARRLSELGFRRLRDSRTRTVVFKLAARRLSEAVETLLAEGWHVEAEGKIYRPAGSFSLSVTSGIDWLEVRGGMRFGDTEVPLPALLKALKKGDTTVRLGDGSYGILPEEWLRRQGLALRLGQAESDHLRYVGSQALVVDQLVQAQPGGRSDEAFQKLREKLRRFAELPAREPPTGFVGELRGYQKLGLGWFGLLDELGFGGCLADDMGLGKTVQVLALLEARREAGPAGAGTTGGTAGRARRSTSTGRRPGRGLPSLVVVPRSLLFNWREEARRFAPDLEVLEHSGPGRAREAAGLAGWNVVLTTYGTLRNDIGWLKEVPFDYLILDEAQLIKNTDSVTARAARQLQGRRRLALSGTPIENHLGELWSLFEFLNPGLLGGVSFFRRTLKSPDSLDRETRDVLARFLGPFILRRTKEQVAPELPERVEQTLVCELLPAERRQYRELQDYYRRALAQRVEATGLGHARIQILEALLRLRQAACHPGLLDPAAVSQPGAKLDLLLAQLEDVVAEERKALVFSQFTSLLAIVRQRLEERGIPYEYLDGRTRDRAGRVERFQRDPAVPLFLISLKAGGLGLNLTAAEYVFLLDPWWNPAAELQAIDRTHRIGQERKVFAYRLIARDTVEEKVLELQKSKRELADSIITADRRLLGELTPADLKFLLS